MTGVAVKLTEVPVQTGFSDAAIVTLTGNEVFTVIVTVFEVAGFPETQGSLDVRTHVTASLFNGI